MERTLDAKGMKCPMPIIKAKKELETLAEGEVLKVIATDKGSVLDMQGWARTNPKVSLVKQETTVDETGREIYLHWLGRK